LEDDDLEFREDDLKDQRRRLFVRRELFRSLASRGEKSGSTELWGSKLVRSQIRWQVIFQEAVQRRSVAI